MSVAYDKLNGKACLKTHSELKCYDELLWYMCYSFGRDRLIIYEQHCYPGGHASREVLTRSPL